MRQSRSHPNRIFATGINLDVRYGIDLVGADTRFDHGKNRLLINLFLYQAKASRFGLSASDVRELSARYADKKSATKEELTLDVDWVKRELLDQRCEPGFEFDDETSLAILTESLSELHAQRLNIDNLNALDRFIVGLRLYSAVRTLALDFGVDIPRNIVRPQIDVGEVEFRYLVDTERGTEDLSEDEAIEYGSRIFLKRPTHKPLDMYEQP